MIQPTVGRVVHYFRDRDSQPQAALIAHVNGDGTVNLAVFDHNGTPEPRAAGITLVQDSTPPLQGHYCEWMAFQKGQAAKTEALEKLVGGASSDTVTFASESQTTFGGVFSGVFSGGIVEPIPVLTDVVDTPVPVEAMSGNSAADPALYEGLETKQYSDGTSATGTAPLPDLSPAQQDSDPSETQPSLHSSDDISSISSASTPSGE